MTETLSTDTHDYIYEPGLDGDVIIEGVSTLPGGGGWLSCVDVRVPGPELKQLVKQAAPRPMVGVSLFIVDDSDEDNVKVLLGKRKGSHGEGEYGTPGGHMENGESPMEGALRELVEECGPFFHVSRPRVLCFTNLTAYLPKHYLDIGVIARYRSGAPEKMEPDKCEGWEWYPINELPTPRFAVIDNLVIAYETGQMYFPAA